ncbi:MAG: DUF3604 domain-containing protein [Pseudomonadota bacterium]
MPHSTYLAHELGTAEISPAGPFVAGSHQPLTITYTAGRFGIDDTGGIKISFRNSSDSGRPQITDPAAPSYVTAAASNGAVLAMDYNRNNIRPFGNTIYIRVVRGFLREGDQITVHLGDPAQGSPGYRLQTACEEEFFFKTFVDAFATYDFVELPSSPSVRLIPGPAASYKLVLPTLRRVGEPFRLAIVANDRWSNPTADVSGQFKLRSTSPIEGLPDGFALDVGQAPITLDGLSVGDVVDLWIDLLDAEGRHLARSNPLRIVEDAPFVHYWGDLHGQSKETIGLNSADAYYAFARDKAFVDIVGHQGNDFQITGEFWAEINRLAALYDEPGQFVALPGYEWSGNTGKGGDRNVFFLKEDRPIFRSSRVLLHDTDDEANDCYEVTGLFEKLEGEDAIVIAHVGGRYAELRQGHDGRFERAVEVHSCWGTFEWLLHDAFELGYRVGVVAHSDDHKGRPGAAYPGAALFGALGGLTCYQMASLDRPTLFQTVRQRHHYGTSGTRLYLDVQAAGAFEFLADDPVLGPVSSEERASLSMGDIGRTSSELATLTAEVLGAAPIERLTFFNGTDAVATRRSFGTQDMGARIRVLFEGAEYRGRGREVLWKGAIKLQGNRYQRHGVINLFNVDKTPAPDPDGSELAFDLVTTGNFSGFDFWLDDPRAGNLTVESSVLTHTMTIRDIGFEETIIEAGGLGKRLRLFRLPDELTSWHVKETANIPLKTGADNPLWVRITQEDGHQAWSSPIYLIP